MATRGGLVGDVLRVLREERAAIAVMVVPYAMLHVDKPLAEALMAIAGGAALGWLALRAETIWGGVLVHAAMALTMDVAALAVQGAWPGRW